MSIELYESSSPQAAKWVLPDGRVTSKMPISGGSGGTDNHAELDNLSYPESGHTGFASQAELETISGRVTAIEEAGIPHVSAYLAHEFLPGLRLCRITYGKLYNYWIEGEFAGAELQTIAPGQYIATVAEFPELALYQGGKVTVMAGFGRAAKASEPDEFDLTLFNIGSTGIALANFLGVPLDLYPPDASHGGTTIAFTQILILGTPGS